MCTKKDYNDYHTPDGGTSFGVFWQAYPRRAGKAAARKAFDKATAKVSLTRILEAIAAQRKAGMFPDDIAFVPHPATWLNQERWDDEIVQRVQAGFKPAANHAQNYHTAAAKEGEDYGF